MNLSDMSTFLLEWFCSGDFSIEANILSDSATINNATKRLPSAINQAHALQQFYVLTCISYDQC